MKASASASAFVYELRAITHRSPFQFVPSLQDSVRAGQVDCIDVFAVVDGLENHLQGCCHWLDVHRV